MTPDELVETLINIGRFAKDEYIRDMVKAEVIKYGESVRQQAVRVCRDKVDPDWPNDDISNMAKSCAAAIEKMELP